MFQWLAFSLAFLLCQAVAGAALKAVPAHPSGVGRNSDENTGRSQVLVTIAECVVVRGDPVPLLVRVENRGPAAVTIVVPQVVPPDRNTIRLSVRSPGEPDFRSVAFPGIYCGALKGQAKPPPLPVINLSPGQVRSFRAYLGWDFHPADERQRRWLFPTAGEYAVRLTIWRLATAAPAGTDQIGAQSPITPLEAAAGLIKVVEPSEPADVVAADALLRMPSQWCVYAPTCVGAVVPADLLDFRKQHADTRYAPFTELAIIYGNFWAAIASKDKASARRACDRARSVAERAEVFAWPDGWRAEAERMSRVMTEQLLSFRP